MSILISIYWPFVCWGHSIACCFLLPRSRVYFVSHLILAFIQFPTRHGNTPLAEGIAISNTVTISQSCLPANIPRRLHKIGETIYYLHGTTAGFVIRPILLNWAVTFRSWIKLWSIVMSSSNQLISCFSCTFSCKEVRREKKFKLSNNTERRRWGIEPSRTTF